jgi:hypothetical protein
MPESHKPIPLVFWRSATGREPVREWLNELSREDKRTIGRDIAKVQYGWPIGLPLCRPLSAGLSAAEQARGACILRISRWHADRRARDDQEDTEDPGGRFGAGTAEV